MLGAILGRKLGMTRVFTDDGVVVPVTIIAAGPCTVVDVRDNRVQLGFEQLRPTRATKAALGHAAKAGLDAAPRVLRTVPQGEADVAVGQTIDVAQFEHGDRVKVTGTTKGRGFQGVVHRYGIGGGPASHGNTRHRKPGSIGPGTDPSRVIKGRKMPGQMGAVRHTALGLIVVRVDPERHLLFVRGAVPGPMRGIVMVRKQKGKSRHA
jgi:large subunit ribosomal protein L3